MHAWITHACFAQWQGNYFAFVTTEFAMRGRGRRGYMELLPEDEDHGEGGLVNQCSSLLLFIFFYLCLSLCVCFSPSGILLFVRLFSPPSLSLSLSLSLFFWFSFVFLSVFFWSPSTLSPSVLVFFAFSFSLLLLALLCPFF
jgi:hypothetical protein